MATTTNQLTVFSSSSPPSWDVFLSFYGKDTRGNFIAHLYKALDQAGIETFMDEPELEKGEEISEGILKAIHGSKMSVVVLSENFARSKWCLDELVEILSCNRTSGQVVIPVFYYVDPSNVRHHQESFGEALESQKNLYSVRMVEKWKSALAEIGKLKGYHLKKDANQNELKTIQGIVEIVAPQASTKKSHLEEYIFGIGSVVEEIYQKVSLESNDIRAIGICGMGGIGKTTIAKAFYNKYSENFHISCFIENIKQNSKGGISLLPFLNQLLNELQRKDYTIRNVESGIRQLKRIINFKRALIVLDDLDQSSYSELFASLCNIFSAGSRIMVTTRDVNLVNKLKVDISGVVDIYMVKELEQKEALKLFSYHVFRKTMPCENFRALSVQFVNYVGGLPLALKLLGSSLRGRNDESFWKAQFDKVRVNPEIHNIVKLSYDELGDWRVKAIFLDIVFFFIGKDRDEGVHVFGSCDFYPKAGIPVLVERCLLTVDKNNKFQMHNLIHDMGREIIREESKHGKCRHLYLCPGNACEALQKLQGADKTEGLILDLTMWTKRHFSAKIFERLPNLRLLEIIGVHDIKGNFENSFHELRCIRWHHCPWTRLPSSFRPRNLVSLDMSCSKLKTLWKGTAPLVSLKTVDISYSKNLKTTSDFSKLKLLEKLILRGCRSLLKVHPSIGHLTNLVHLDLGECYHLKELTEPMGQMIVSGHLDFSGCLRVKRLPEPIKQLTNLGHLDLGRCCNLKLLPEQLGEMKCLKLLDASYTAIEQLPDSVAQLKGLVKLNLHKCKNLRKLPEQFGNLEGLKALDASSSAIQELPDSFASLVNLVELDLNSCKNLTSLPDSIWKLKFLKVLYLGGISKLKRLPEQLGMMECLEDLTAGWTAIDELPDSIGLLSKLQLLHLSCCEKLASLPNSISNLTSLTQLYVDIDRIDLPDTVKNMKKLECLHLRCDIRLWQPMILSFSSLKNLTLRDQGDGQGSSLPELPRNLEELSVHDHTSLEQLPNLSFKQLKKLDIQKCFGLESLPPLPPHVKLLEARDCTSLPDLSILKNLEELHNLRISSNLKVSLEDSSLQVEQFSSFKANLSNREIAEWFSYKRSGSAVSFDIPPSLEDNFLGVALWVVYTCKTAVRFSYIRAAITNKTEGITNNYDIIVPYASVGEVQSRVECIKRKTGDSVSEVQSDSEVQYIGEETISAKCGDGIMVSFQSLLYSSPCGGGEKVPTGEVKVEMCGAHVIQKTPSTPC